MPCPSCGGTRRNPIAPGYWECTTAIDDPAIVKSAWDVADPWRAATFPQRPCGHRYQDGPVVKSEPCQCGTYSIGRCGRCDEPVCGDHGTPHAGGLHCKRCARALLEEDQRRKREVADARAAAREKLKQSAEEAIRRATEALGNSGRPPERLAVVKRIETSGSGGPGGGRPGTSWLEIEREMGLGWYVGRFVWTARGEGESMSSHLALTEKGGLLEGSGLFGRWDKAEGGFHLRVRPGWVFPRFRKPVLAVKPDEFGLERSENDSLGDLTSGLLEIAAGETLIPSWGQRLSGSLPPAR
jgi:hypothetical protein